MFPLLLETINQIICDTFIVAQINNIIWHDWFIVVINNKSETVFLLVSHPLDPTVYAIRERGELHL